MMAGSPKLLIQAFGQAFPKAFLFLNLPIFSLGEIMYHLLVIDDEKEILDIIKIILSKAGYKVVTALDGQKGITKFDNGQFDLVITDINMPGLDGRKVFEHIRNSDRPCTPIIGVSGTPWLLKDIPFDAVFIKPFPLMDLVNSIRHLIMQVGSDCDLI